MFLRNTESWVGRRGCGHHGRSGVRKHLVLLRVIGSSQERRVRGVISRHSVGSECRLRPAGLFSRYSDRFRWVDHTSRSSEACSRTVTRWPLSEMDIAAIRPPSPAPTIAKCN
jgi:hypothetical protein